MGREGRAGNLHGAGGGKPQWGVGKHHCWVSARSPVFPPGQTRGRGPNPTVASPAVQQDNKGCSAGKSHQDHAVVSHPSPGTGACVLAASPHSQCQMKVNRCPPALAQLGSAGPAVWGCRGRSALRLSCAHGSWEPAHAGVGPGCAAVAVGGPRDPAAAA